jgi:2-succinyl-5-enolpyruvyl-6-hydroxy-3-cyclohexene-1-carboxylate synthase
VNVCFDEPLDCIADGIDFEDSKPSASPGEASSGSGARFILESWLETREGLVVLASGIHPSCVESVTRFLHAINAPVVAEATSNLHGHADLHDLLVTGGDRALSQMKVRRVLRIGSVPSGRWWRDLEQHPEIAVLNICDPPFPGLARTENVETTGLDLLRYECDHCVGARVTSTSATLRTQFESIVGACPKSEPAWIRHLSRAIPAGARVFLGNSLPIREWNLAADPPRSGTAFFANRGANGIDGIVSTFLGVSATTLESWLIIGDLSALYDLSAPWILKQLPAGNRRIVVINNGGGKIFSRVDSLRSLDEQTRAVIENRHALSFESWAQMWGMRYTLCTSADQLAALPDGNSVIEINPDTAQTELFWAQWTSK